MDRKQIDHLLNNCNLPDSCENKDLITTHISWVILTDNYAFKIKRPVKYSFLDFSSLEKRKFFCNEDIKTEINRVFKNLGKNYVENVNTSIKKSY